MEAGRCTVFRILAYPPRGEYELPEPLGGRIRVLPIESRGQGNAAIPGCNVALVLHANALEMALERRAQRVRQHHPAILLALAATYRQLAALEVPVLDAQLETFLQPQPGAVQQRRNQPRHPDQLAQDQAHLVDGEHNGHTHRHLGGRRAIDGPDLPLQHLGVKEQ